MLDYRTARLRVVSSFDQFTANRNCLRSNCLDTLQQAFVVANALDVRGLPDDPAPIVVEALDRIDAALEQVVELILARLEDLEHEESAA